MSTAFEAACAPVWLSHVQEPWPDVIAGGGRGPSRPGGFSGVQLPLPDPPQISRREKEQGEERRGEEETEDMKE